MDKLSEKLRFYGRIIECIFGHRLWTSPIAAAAYAVKKFRFSRPVFYGIFLLAATAIILYFF
jgi:hypothetical protein